MTSLNGVPKRWLAVKETSNCEIVKLRNRELLSIRRKIAHQEFWVALLLASAASLKVTDFLFVKQQHN